MAQIQLASAGSADIFLTGTPQVTFFRTMYKRHVAFSQESIENVFQGPSDFGTRSTVTLQKAGDLCGAVWLQVQLPDLTLSSAFSPQTRQPADATIQQAYHTAQTATSIVVGLPTTGSYAYATAMLANSAVTANLAVPSISTVAATGASGYAANISITAPSGTAPSTYTANVFYSNNGVFNNVEFTGVVGASSVEVGNVNYPVSVGNTFGVKVYGTYSGNGVHTRLSEPVYFSSAVANAASNVLTAVSVAGLPFGPGTSWAATAMASSATAASSAGTGQLVNNIKWANNLGSVLLAAIEYEIGGTRIERHQAPWYDMRQQLTEKAEKKAGIDSMLLNYDDEYDIWNWDKSSNAAKLLFIPLRFAWNRSPSMALPLVALQFNDLKLGFEFAPYLACVKSSQSFTTLSSAPSVSTMQCFVDYFFIDQAERVRFASNPSEYLIEVVQFQGAETVLGSDSPSGTVLNRKIMLNFSQPTKELVWVYQTYANYQVDPVNGNSWFDYNVSGAPSLEPFVTSQLFFNGHQRFAARPSQYFRQVVPYQFHTRVPTKKVYAWSSALNPEDDLSPSGSFNASRLDNIQLAFVVDASTLTGRVLVFAVSWNVLRISNGMGGLVFSSG